MEIVPKYSVQMNLSTEKLVPLDGNHVEITKFADKSDNNYNTISKHIKRFVDQLEKEASYRRNPYYRSSRIR